MRRQNSCWLVISRIFFCYIPVFYGGIPVTGKNPYRYRYLVILATMRHLSIFKSTGESSVFGSDFKLLTSPRFRKYVPVPYIQKQFFWKVTNKIFVL
jgi:hypothetical protein